MWRRRLHAEDKNGGEGYLPVAPSQPTRHHIIPANFLIWRQIYIFTDILMSTFFPLFSYAIWFWFFNGYGPDALTAFFGGLLWCSKWSQSPQGWRWTPSSWGEVQWWPRWSRSTPGWWSSSSSASCTWCLSSVSFSTLKTTGATFSSKTSRFVITILRRQLHRIGQQNPGLKLCHPFRKTWSVVQGYIPRWNK